MVYGKLMSSWPVCSVMAQDGVLYGIAGLYTQNGSVVFALDAATGRPRWTRWTAPGYSSYTTLQEEHQPFTPAGHLAMVGDKLWVRTLMGVPAIFDARSGERLKNHPTLVEIQKTNYWTHGIWFAARGRDIVVVDDHFVLQGGAPLMANPDERHAKHGARFIGYRVDESGLVPGFPHPPEAVPGSMIAPALDKMGIATVGALTRQPRQTTNLAVWTLDAWYREAYAATVAMLDERHSDAPEERKPYLLQKRVRAFDMAHTLWSRPELDVCAIVLCPNAVVVAHGIPAVETSHRGPQGYVGWKLSAFGRKDGAPMWSVDLPGEPIFNGVAPAANGTWVLILRNGSVVSIGEATH
jgi:hypothetical protein